MDGACIVAGISAADASSPLPPPTPPPLSAVCSCAATVLASMLMPEERRPFPSLGALSLTVAAAGEPLPDLHRPFLVILQFSSSTRTTMPPGYSEDAGGSKHLSTVKGRPGAGGAHVSLCHTFLHTCPQGGSPPSFSASPLQHSTAFKDNAPHLGDFFIAGLSCWNKSSIQTSLSC